MAERIVKAIITGSSASAVKAFEETAAAAETSSKRTTAAISESSSASSDKLGGLGGSLGKVAALGAGLVSLEGLKGAAEHFNQTEDATSRLNAAMTAAGESVPNFTDKLGAAMQAGANLGFSSAETADSLAALRLAGVDTSKGMEIQAQIADLARTKHLSLADATSVVVKAMQGSAKAFKDLNLEAPPHLATTAQLDALNIKIATSQTAVTAAQTAYSTAVAAHGVHSTQAIAAATALQKTQATLSAEQTKAADITKQLGDRTGQLDTTLQALHGKTAGQAEAATETLTGKWEKFQAQMGVLTDKLVGAVMPVFNQLLGALGFLADHMDIILPVLGTAVGLFVAWKVAMGAMALAGFIASIIEMGAAFVVMAGEEGLASAASALFNTTLLANPIVLIVAAVVALIAIFIALELKFHFVEAGFHLLMDAMHAAWDWVKSNWPLLLDILLGPFGFVIGWVIQHFSQIKDTVTAVFNDVVGFVAAIPGRVGAALATFASAVWGVLSTALDTVKGWIMDAIDLWIDVYVKFPLKVVTALAGFAATVWAGLGVAVDTIKGWISDAIGLWIDIYIKFPARVVGALAGFGGKVWSGVVAEFNFFRDSIGGVVGDILGFFERMPGNIASKLAGLGGAIGGAVGGALKSAVNGMIGIINNGLGGMGDLGFDSHFGIPGFHVRDLFGGSMPQVPRLAAGGEVLRTGLAIVHQGEVFSGVNGEVPVGGRGGGGVTLNATFNISGAGSPGDTASAVRDALVLWARQTGQSSLFGKYA